MTYQPHALLRFGGRWFDTEQWSCGIRIGTDDNSATVAQWVTATKDGGVPDEPRMLTDFREFVEAWFLRPGSQISNLARLDYVSLNAIGPDGKYADPGSPHTYEYPAGSAPTGPLDAFEMPQLSIVVSLRTEIQRGLATHGRIYPPTGLQLTSAGRVGSTTATGMAESFSTLCEDIAGYDEVILAGAPRVVVASDLGTPGPMRIVTRVLVGDVVDTQRRRRNQLQETYVTSVVDF